VHPCLPDTERRNSADLSAERSVEGEYQPQLTLLPLTTQELETFCDGHNAGQLGGRRRSHVSQHHHSPQLASLSLWQNATLKMLGANPQVSTALGPPFAVKERRETRFERLMRRALQEISLYWILGR